MKNLIKLLILSLMVTFIACQTIRKDKVDKFKQVSNYGNTDVLTIDSCEYIIWNRNYGGGIIHKQNCKFCEQRNQTINH